MIPFSAYRLPFLIAALLAVVIPAHAQERTPALAAERIALHEFKGGGSAAQGVALTAKHYFGSDNKGKLGVIHRFDTSWNWVESREFDLPGVDHIGALSHRDGYLWAGFLHSKGPRKSLVVKIDTRDLSIAATYDITSSVTWIDPVCFDGTHVWVGDMSDMGIHRFRIAGDRLEPDGVLRYPRALHFSQGIQIRGKKLYSIHTFGDWDGLMEFDLTQFSDGKTLQPLRVWQVPETLMHLEGFDFVPGRPEEIWHAQGKAAEHLRLVDF